MKAGMVSPMHTHMVLSQIAILIIALISQAFTIEPVGLLMGSLPFFFISYTFFLNR